jgi:hypothetical protein
MKWLLLLLLSACATLPEAPVSSADDTAYVKEHPYYAELCALSEIGKKPGFGAEIVSGGPGGHSVLYLNGVCRDRAAGYPVIGLCDPAHGVGISSNAHFSNAAWVAVDGRDRLFGPDDAGGLTRDEYSALRMDAQRSGIYDGVIFHDAAFSDIVPGYDHEAWKYEVSIGTDYAIGIARSRYCARTPLTEDQMGQVVDRLNRINQPYRTGEKQFEWSVLHNNCAHITHDGLAASCDWNEWPADQSFLEAGTDMPVPKNEFVDLMRRGNDLPIGDPVALYRDDAARQDLMQNNHLPSEPGTLAYYQPVLKPNEVYDTDLRLIFYDDPITGAYAPWLDSIMEDRRYTDEEANRAWFAEEYRRAKAGLKPLDELMPELTPLEQTDFPAFYRRYVAYIAEQRRVYE